MVFSKCYTFKIFCHKPQSAWGPHLHGSIALDVTDSHIPCNHGEHLLDKVCAGSTSNGVFSTPWGTGVFAYQLNGVYSTPQLEGSVRTPLVCKQFGVPCTPLFLQCGVFSAALHGAIITVVKAVSKENEMALLFATSVDFPFSNTHASPLYLTWKK